MFCIAAWRLAGVNYEGKPSNPLQQASSKRARHGGWLWWLIRGSPAKHSNKHQAKGHGPRLSVKQGKDKGRSMCHQLLPDQSRWAIGCIGSRGGWELTHTHPRMHGSPGSVNVKPTAAPVPSTCGLL
eukprot:1160005-Pelagomonas_calceolata.AAC.10